MGIKTNAGASLHVQGCRLHAAGTADSGGEVMIEAILNNALLVIGILFLAASLLAIDWHIEQRKQAANRPTSPCTPSRSNTYTGGIETHPRRWYRNSLLVWSIKRRKKVDYNEPL